MTGSPRRRAARCAPGVSRSCARDPKYYSPTITAVMLPEGHDADAFRKSRARELQHLLRRELRPLRGQVLPHRPSRRHQRRLMLIGALGSTEMALALAGIPHKKGGVQAAMDYIVSAHARRRAPSGGVTLFYAMPVDRHPAVSTERQA